jgi:hypothetical protein
MNDQRIRDLLHEVADGIEPDDRLDAIRAATAPGRTPSAARAGWWVAGGAASLAASLVVAVALTTGPGPGGEQQGPAGPASTTPTGEPCCEVLPVYFVGDTPAGPRLYREFQQAPAPAATFALGAALRGESLDPDYRSSWPADTELEAYRVSDDLITVSLSGAVRERPAGMDQAEARLAIEQVVRTAQGILGRGQVPVLLLIEDQPAGEVLGVPTSAPLTVGSDLAVLAHVSLSDPSEGTTVDNDEPFTVTGVGNSFEGNIVTRIQRWEGTDIVDEKPVIAGWLEDRLFPFEVTFDLTDVPPGDYVVISRTDDPTGEGRFHTDSRRITVVD